MSGSSGSLTKVGNGTLTFGNINTYAGGTTVNSGTLALATGGPTRRDPRRPDINPGRDGQLTGDNGLGYSGGSQTYVPTVNIVGGDINIANNSWEAFTTNFTLTGGTMSGDIAATTNPFFPAYNFSPSGYGITTYGSTATSLISTCIYGSRRQCSLQCGQRDGPQRNRPQRHRRHF